MKPLIKVHLVRHGEAVFNLEHKYQGQADSGLTERGYAQAAAVGEALASLIPEPAAVVSSDLPRTMATARPYLDLVGKEALPDEDWRELDVGTWAGRTFDEMRVASHGGTADYHGMTWDRIEAEHGIFWPCPEEGHPGTPRLYEGGRFAHPDGKARFHAVTYRPPAEVVDDDYPVWLTTGTLRGS